MAVQGSVVYKILGDNSQYKTSIQDAQAAAERAASQIGSALKAAAFAGAAALASAVSMGVKYNAQIEQITKTFEGLLQSEEKAGALMDALTGYAQSTSFEVEGLARSAQKLLAYGMDDAELMDTIRMLGDISMGSTERMEYLALALGQVQAKGHLMTQDLRQMQEQGFNPLEYIARQTGETMQELIKRVESAGVSFDEVAGAMKFATSEGQKFYKMTDLQSDSVIGKWNELKEKANEAFGALTSEINDKLKNKILPGVIKAIDQINVDGITKDFKNFFTVLKAGLPIISSVVGAMAAWKTALAITHVIEKVHKAWALFSTTLAGNPLVLVGMALAGLTAALVAYMSTSEKAITTASMFIDQSKALRKEINDTADAYENMEARRAEAGASAVAEADRIERLYNELLNLTDASGQVEEAERGRAAFILGELNSALGTEYTMTGNMINSYSTLTSEMYGAIEAKRAYLLLEAEEASYVEAVKLQNEAAIQQRQLQNDLIGVETELRANNAERMRLEAEAAAKYGDAWRYNGRAMAEYSQQFIALNGENIKLQEEQQRLNESLVVVTETLAGSTEQIRRYEEASAAAAEGDYARAEAILTSYVPAIDTAVATTGEKSAEFQQQLGEVYANAALDLHEYGENFKKGLPGYTEEGLQEAYDKFAEAESAFFAAGGQIVDGVVQGLDGRRWYLKNTLQSLAADCKRWFNVTLRIQSPSKEFGESGKNIVLGAANAVRDNAPLATQEVEKMAEGMQNAFDVETTVTHKMLATTTPAAAPAPRITLTGDVLMDGYKVGEQVMRNFDDVAALNVGGLNL